MKKVYNLGASFPATVVVVVLGFYFPRTTKFIQRLDLGLKPHPKDWISLGLHSRPLVYTASSLTKKNRGFFPAAGLTWCVKGFETRDNSV